MLAHPLHSAERKPNEHRQPGVSEVILPAGDVEAADLILPMLAHLSHQSKNRWLTWICPSLLPKDMYRNYGFSLQNVRTILSKNDEQSLWVMWDAINNGTSEYVVAGFHHNASVSQRERQLLESACHNGNTRALILKFSQ